ERLPAAAAWLGKTVRRVREYATGARDQLRSELGPEFDELRKPLEDLRSIRGFNARQAVAQHLFDGDDPFDGRTDERTTNGQRPSAAPSRSPDQRPLQTGEQAPFDPEST